jgi:hypothetical protein
MKPYLFLFMRQAACVTMMFMAAIAFAQAPPDDFSKFASQQNLLLTQAYEKKDIKAYDKSFGELLARYNTLPEPAKKKYGNYISNAYYNFSCTYALVDNKPMAVTHLKNAMDAGYINYSNIKLDPDLNSIRNEREFNDQIARIRNVGDYLYILRKADKYNDADSRPLPGFTYQSANDPNLQALRKDFKLDSIAGKGNTTFQIINLLHWVHNLIPHDGNHENPTVKNAMSMIAECKRDHGRGLNCRGLATVLNECYLALGFKSRIVTCLPKDSLKVDSDCHVINAVYSDVSKKWLWIDPTNDAYVLNEKGELLSIEEVRSRIIHDEPLLLNPDANWNRQVATKEAYLLHYMAKNLYILESPVNSQYDMETFGPSKKIEYVRLLPLDYYQQAPDKTEQTSKKFDTTWIYHKTNNSRLFWQAP